MLFKNDDESLKLEIRNYEIPADEAAPGSDDQNWLVLRATWTQEDGTIVKDSNSCLLTYELQEMTAGLKVLKAGIKTSYVSEFQEPYFTVSSYAEEGKGFWFYVSFFLPNTMDGDDTAEVKCLMSEDEMNALVDELDQLCIKYPDRK